MKDRNSGEASHSRWQLLAVLITLYPSDASAYIDPGSGSLLLQIVMSALFGAIFLARNFLIRIAATTRRLLFGVRADKTNPPGKPDA